VASVWTLEDCTPRLDRSASEFGARQPTSSDGCGASNPYGHGSRPWEWCSIRPPR